jgi:hypothetical protein
MFISLALEPPPGHFPPPLLPSFTVHPAFSFSFGPFSSGSSTASY